MFDQQRLEVNGCTIRLRRAGAGTPLLYLHGANGVPRVPAFLDALCDDFDVLVPEHPGFGESDDPAWLEGMDDLAYFYLDFLDRLNLQRLHIIGSSLGGWLALELAIRQPQRFRSLLLIGTAGITLAQIPPGDSFRWTAEESVRHTFHGDAWVGAALAQPADAATAAKNRHTIARLAWSPRFHHPMLHKRLHRVAMPVLLAWGENDRIIPVEYGVRLQHMLPDARLTRYPECGHLPQVERQQDFTRDALQFLEHLPA